MRQLILVFVFLSFEIFGQRVENVPFGTHMSAYKASRINSPFELTVYSSDFSQALALRYVLTEKDLKVTLIGTLEGEKDRLIYRNDLIPNRISKTITDIDIDKLDQNYANPCILDGSQLTVHFNTDAKSKTVHLSNFYQKDIGFIIESINSLVPRKYTIGYNKKILIRKQEECSGL